MVFLNNFFRVYNILENKEKVRFVTLLLSTLFITILELISLGSIPIYISLIFDPSLINNYLVKFDLNFFTSFIQSENFIYYSSFCVVLAFLLKNIFVTIFYYLNLRFITDLNIRIGNKIFHNNIYSDYLYHIDRSPAELIRNHGEIMRFTNMMGHYQRLFLEVVLLIFILFITLKIYFEITVLFFGLFTLFFIIYYSTFKKWISTAGRKAQIYHKIQYGILDNTFSGIKEIKFNLKESFFKKLFKSNYFKMNRVILIQSMLNKLPKISLEILAVTSIILISLFFYINGNSDVSKITNLSFLSVIAIRLIPAFNSISVAATAIKYAEPSIDLVEKDLKNVTFYSSKVENNIKFEQYSEKIKSIKIDNLSFNYGNEKEHIFNEINFSINEKDKIGFSGKSGSGKTTIINLLTGLISPTKGNVFFNDVNIHNKTNMFYNKIGYVTQDPILFNDTIQNNITFNSDEIDKIKLNKILEICRLDDFIKNTPLGLNAIVGEKGLKISGGQKQRIGIARALYKNFDILILDEATSALSKEYEKNILDTIFKLYGDKIIIIVSHNINNLNYCKKILNIKEHHINIRES